MTYTRPSLTAVCVPVSSHTPTIHSCACISWALYWHVGKIPSHHRLRGLCVCSSVLKIRHAKSCSSGAVLAVNIVNRILEHRKHFGPASDDAQLPLPVSLVLNYAALDFNFTSWMSAENLQVLQYEQSSGNLPGLAELALQKNHLQHVVRPSSMKVLISH